MSIKYNRYMVLTCSFLFMQDTTGEKSYRDFFHNHAKKEHILLELNKIISPSLLL